MNALKEQLLLDLPVFFNPREFGEEMLIDGLSCIGLWSEEKDEPVKQFFGSSFDNVMGVFTVDRALYVALGDGGLMVVPVPEQELDIDGKTWTVKDAVVEGGVVKLVLYRNES
ncbi:MAG: hypothetical protein FWF31_09885 [Desulfobulbus sp.]|nr:hypothetical protein [Desulfobulbus sp.]